MADFLVTGDLMKQFGVAIGRFRRAIDALDLQIPRAVRTGFCRVSTYPRLR